MQTNVEGNQLSKKNASQFHPRPSNDVDTFEGDFRMASSNALDDSYVVGVVEFRPELLNMDIRVRTERHYEAYRAMVLGEEARVSFEKRACYRTV